MIICQDFMTLLVCYTSIMLWVFYIFLFTVYMITILNKNFKCVDKWFRKHHWIAVCVVVLWILSSGRIYEIFLWNESSNTTQWKYSIVSKSPTFNWVKMQTYQHQNYFQGPMYGMYWFLVVKLQNSTPLNIPPFMLSFQLSNGNLQRLWNLAKTQKTLFIEPVFGLFILG